MHGATCLSVRAIQSLLAIVLAVISRIALAQEPPPAVPAETAAPAAPGAGATPVVVAPPAVAAPPPAVAAPPPPAAPPPRPAWRPRDARFAIGVEHLFAFETLALQSTQERAPDGSTAEFTTLRTTFPFSSDRFAVPRLAFDVLFGGTVGAYFGYSRDAQSAVFTDPFGRTEDPERGTVSGTAGARGGVIVGHGTAVALWLRGGVGYWWSSDFPSSESGFSSRAFFLALDPVVIIAPLPRLALTFGPYLEAASGSRTHRTKGVTDPGELTWIDLTLRFTTNLSVMF
jgi:hypothetical protein